MEIVNDIEVDRERVKERVDSYITNKGYRIERMITSERFGILSIKDIPLGAQAVYYLTIGMNENKTLRELFAPIGEVYSKGRGLFAKASVLTPKYAQRSKENERLMQNLQRLQQDATQETSKRLSKFGIFGRWLLSRKSKAIGDFYRGVLSHVSSSLPKPVPTDVSISALDELYSWSQIGAEDSDSTRASNELAHLFDLLTEEQIRLLKIKRDLYKIKNHTAIVCLDQLKRDGLTLDTIVASELDRIPREYMADVLSYGKLRTGSSDSFGEGLF